MKKFAVVFAGQGSQSVGMFASFIEDPEVKRTYEEANDALSYDLKKISLEGPAEELNKTEVTQPAILAASVAALRALKSRIDAVPAAVAGHSLGEYSALVAAGALDFADALRLVRLRGQAMQAAVPQGKGAMAAVLGLADDVVIDGCKSVSQDGDAVWAANFNTPGQVVISGAKEAVDRAAKFFAENGAKRVVPLAVSAPSHCPMMQSAADKLKEALSSITLKDAAIPVYCNAYAKPLTAKDEIVKALILQLVGPVRWVECVKAMQSDGVSALIECGPGKVLCGLNRKIDKSLDLANICDEDSLNKAIELIK